MPLKQWRKAIKSRPEIRNPYGLVTPGLADVVIVQGGNGNGFRNERPWLKLALVDGELKRFGRDTMPDGFAPVMVNGLRAWVRVPAEEAVRPCSESVSRSHGRAPHTSHPCDRAADGEDGLCAQHRGVAARAAAKSAAAAETSARSGAGLQIASDAVAALEDAGISATVHYHRAARFADSGYSGSVVVHAEDVLALLRELDELREMRDML